MLFKVARNGFQHFSVLFFDFSMLPLFFSVGAIIMIASNCPIIGKPASYGHFRDAKRLPR